MTIKQLVKEAYRIAKSKGWHETPRSPLEIAALIHSEISEAVEEARAKAPGKPIYQVVGVKAGFISQVHYPAPGEEHWKPGREPMGELIELADAVIRIADYCGAKGWDLDKAIKLKMAFNEGREYRHGGKKF